MQVSEWQHELKEIEGTLVLITDIALVPQHWKILARFQHPKTQIAKYRLPTDRCSRLSSRTASSVNTSS